MKARRRTPSDSGVAENAARGMEHTTFHQLLCGSVGICRICSGGCHSLHLERESGSSGKQGRKFGGSLAGFWRDFGGEPLFTGSPVSGTAFFLGFTGKKSADFWRTFGGILAGIWRGLVWGRAANIRDFVTDSRVEGAVCQKPCDFSVAAAHGRKLAKLFSIDSFLTIILWRPDLATDCPRQSLGGSGLLPRGPRRLAGPLRQFDAASQGEFLLHPDSCPTYACPLPTGARKAADPRTMAPFGGGVPWLLRRSDAQRPLGTWVGDFAHMGALVAVTVTLAPCAGRSCREAPGPLGSRIEMC